LERSRKSYSGGFTSWDGDCKPPWRLNFDRSSFPTNLRPIIDDFMPWLLNIDPSLFA
jgi:hypothetical protein